MKKNVGTVDKIVRILVGLVIGAVGIYYQSWWGLIAILPIASALAGCCTLYNLVGISTCKTEKR